MVKAAKGSAGIHLNLGNDYPVKIEFDLAGGNGHVTYLLAPRIES
jgi:proliferating cell nuclear antigen